MHKVGSGDSILPDSHLPPSNPSLDEAQQAYNRVIEELQKVQYFVPAQHLFTAGAGNLSFVVSDFLGTLRSYGRFLQVNNPVLTTAGLSSGVASFNGLIAAISDLEGVLQGSPDLEKILEGGAASLTHLMLSLGGFCYLVAMPSAVFAATGVGSTSYATHLALSSGAVGTIAYMAFFAGLGALAACRLSNRLWHIQDIEGLFPNNPKAAFLYLKRELGFSYKKFHQELQGKHGENLGSILEEEAILAYTPLYNALSKSGDAPSSLTHWIKEAYEDFWQLGGAVERKNAIKNFAEKITADSQIEGFGNDLRLSPLAFKGFAIAFAKRKMQIEEQMVRLVGEEAVREMLKSEGNNEENISAMARSGYRMGIVKDLGLIVIGAIGVALPLVTHLFRPIIILGTAIVFYGLMAIGYDFPALKALLQNEDPVTVGDKLGGYLTLAIGIAGVLGCVILLGASVASFGTVPLAIAGVGFAAWLSITVYHLYRIHVRENLWEENEKIWKTIRTELIPIEVSSDKIKKIDQTARYKIENSPFLSQHKRTELRNRLSSLELSSDSALRPLDDMYLEIKKALEEEERRLKKILEQSREMDLAP